MNTFFQSVYNLLLSLLINSYCKFPRYSLCVISSEKLRLINTFVPMRNKLRTFVEQLQMRADQVSDFEMRQAGGDHAVRMAAGGHERLGWMPSGFVKERLGDEQAPARSVADLLNDSSIYEKLHK